MGKKWLIRYVSNLTGPKPQIPNSTVVNGKCVYSDKEIMIANGQSEFDELDTIIHEIVHAGCPFLIEDFVKEFSTDLANIMWQLGYRKTSSED